MKKILVIASSLFLAVFLPLQAQESVEKILDLSSVTSNTEEVTAQPVEGDFSKGVIVTIKPGNNGYPGVNIKPKGFPVWDLSSFGNITAKLTNAGTKPLLIALRVDNDGDWKETPNNTEQTMVKPGETKDLTVIFGHSYGGKPAYALKPSEVNNVLVFTTKSKEEQVIRIENIKAAGPAGQKPAQDPRSIRIKPVDGVVLTPKTVLDVKTGATAAFSADGKSVEAKITKVQPLVLRPEEGRWDFRDANQVRVKLKNSGTSSFSPRVRIASQGGSTDTATVTEPLSPGAAVEIVVSFIPGIPWQGTVDPRQETKQEKVGNWNAQKEGTGTKFTSDSVSGVEISLGEKDNDGFLVIESVIADAGTTVMPEWLGKKPPVEGDWIQTFSDEFDGTELDRSKWNVYTANYWDKKTWFSKDNVIMGGGLVKLRYEKRTGRHNDDPNGKELPYACGFLDSYGKWVQRYGYFESRMKLPKAPGLWPAFWTMPDRGLAAGEQWKRASTENGGMEFDIMEHLTRWGPYRFNQAFHWDGYNKAHQALGTSQLYIQTDKDGFFTSGLLWTPGLAVYYVNGKEVGRWETPRICTIESYPIFYMVSGGWDNNQLDDKMLPVDFEIDYIRVWQRKDLASSVDGVKSTQRTLAAPTTPDQAVP